MEYYVINQTPIAQEIFTRNKLGSDRVLVDACNFQNVKRTPVGQLGISTDGFYEGWTLKAGGRTVNGIYPGEDWKLEGWETNQIVILDKFKDWVKTLPTDVKWLLIDIEGIPYSIDNPDKADPRAVEKTHRLLRKLHVEAKKIRPDINYSLYCEGGTMPNYFINGNYVNLYKENVNSPNNLLYRKKCQRLTYGISDSGSYVNSKGIFKANELVSGVQYLYLKPNQSKEDIALEAKWLYDTIKILNAGNAGVYVSPLSHIGIPNDKGYHWSEPISVSLAAYHGGLLRRIGFKGVIQWGYQSDFASQLTNNTDPAIRDAMRTEVYKTKWEPVLNAFKDAYL